MWNDTGPWEDSPPLMLSTEAPYKIDESSYSVFFSTYHPDSPVYSQNNTDFGISIGFLKFTVEGVGISTLALLGTVGNILSICVLSSPRMKNSSSVFLICLAVCDIVSLIGALILIGIPSLLTYHPEAGKDESVEKVLFVFNENIVKYANVVPSAKLYAFSVTAITGSIYFTMALTLERYLAVCHPFIARSCCTWSRAGFVSAVIILLSIVYNLPRWWEFSYVEEVTNIDDGTGSQLSIFRPVPTPLRTNPTYDTYYSHLSYVLLLFFVPVCFLIIFNILIYRQIKLANKLRKNLSPTQKHENSLTRMLFGVVAVFLLCNLAPAIQTMYRYAMGTREFLPEAEFMLLFLIVLNSSVNFLIYCATGGKFKEVFYDMFCCWWGSSTRIGQFAASTKTTFRSISSSTYSYSRRSRAYSVQSTTTNINSIRRYSNNHHLNNQFNNNAIFPDGKFSLPPRLSPLPPSSLAIPTEQQATTNGSIWTPPWEDRRQMEEVEEANTPATDVSFVI